MIRVGPAGWSYADWEGRVYPRPKPAGFHPLAYLARYVGCLEVNSTFYALPDPRHVARWARLVEPHPDFRLLAKLNQGFTHGDLPADAGAWRAPATAFRESLGPLVEAGRLAALLVQFPVTFRRTAAAVERLDRLRALFGDLPLVLEVRHRGWFEPEALGELRDLGYSLAHIDLPEARDHPPDGHEATGPIGYLRLHGRNAEQWFRREAGRDQRYDYLYSSRELRPLVERARRLAGEHDEVFVVTNNHFAGKAMANAIEILAELEGGPVPAPPPLVASFPHLEPLARPEGQGTLF